MDDEINVWLYNVISNKNGYIESVQVCGRLNSCPTNVIQFAYRNGKLKRISNVYCNDCSAPLYTAMQKYAKEIFKECKGRKITL